MASLPFVAGALFGKTGLRPQAQRHAIRPIPLLVVECLQRRWQQWRLRRALLASVRDDENIDEDNDIMYYRYMYVVLDDVPSSSINVLLLLFVKMKILMMMMMIVVVFVYGFICDYNCDFGCSCC